MVAEVCEANLFRLASTRLVERVSQWSQTQWAQCVRVPGDQVRSRADVVHALAQQLGDFTASLEGHKPHPLPRFSSDLVLADQLAVLSHDFLDALESAPSCKALEEALRLVATAADQLDS